MIEHDQRGLCQLIGRTPDLDAEQRLADDLEREVHHLGRNVDRLAARRQAIPAHQHRLGVGCHQPRETRDALAVERGLGQPPLPQPEVTVAGQQPAAGDAAQKVVLEGVFAVILGVVLQHMLDAVGMNHQVDRQRTDGVTHDITVLARDLEQEGMRAVAEGAQVVQRWA